MAGERTAAWWAGVVLVAAAAADLIITPTGVWLSENFAVPDLRTGGNGVGETFVQHGVNVGPGQWVLGAGIGLALLTVVMVVRSRRSWIVAVAAPVVVAAAALGSWAEQVSGTGLPTAPTLAFVGALVAAPAAGLCLPGGNARRWTAGAITVAAAVIAIIIANAVTHSSPRVF